ncbi:MAG: Uma2 family endonuclease [Pyrinomonadaceae bacterium]
MSTVTELFTADQLLHMPSDNFRYELRKGALIKMSPAGFEHGAIAAALTVLLGQYIKANRLGVYCGAETGFKLASDPDTVLAPDFAFVRRERVEQVGKTKKFWPGAPDLAVEVMSPDDTVRKTNEKAGDWIEAGARMVWVINPKRQTVTVFRPSAEAITLTETDMLDGQDVVPGFRCVVAEVFS